MNIAELLMKTKIFIVALAVYMQLGAMQEVGLRQRKTALARAYKAFNTTFGKELHKRTPILVGIPLSVGLIGGLSVIHSVYDPADPTPGNIMRPTATAAGLLVLFNCCRSCENAFYSACHEYSSKHED